MSIVMSDPTTRRRSNDKSGTRRNETKAVVITPTGRPRNRPELCSPPTPIVAMPTKDGRSRDRARSPTITSFLRSSVTPSVAASGHRAR